MASFTLIKIKEGRIIWNTALEICGFAFSPSMDWSAATSYVYTYYIAVLLFHGKQTNMHLQHDGKMRHECYFQSKILVLNKPLINTWFFKDEILMNNHN